MCSGKGIGHWITHSPITPLDSSAASRFANVRPELEARTVSLVVSPAHSGKAQRLVHRSPACAMSQGIRTAGNRDDGRTRGTACSGTSQTR